MVLTDKPICNLCQNKKSFTAQALVEMKITLDEVGAVAKTNEPLVVRESIVCGECGASSEDEHIVNRETGEPVYGGLE